MMRKVAAIAAFSVYHVLTIVPTPSSSFVIRTIQNSEALSLSTSTSRFNKTPFRILPTGTTVSSWTSRHSCPRTKTTLLFVLNKQQQGEQQQQTSSSQSEQNSGNSNVAVVDRISSSSSNDDDDDVIRPLHQNWWPVTILSALDSTRPNAIQVLGKPLVAYASSSTEWTVLDDRCSHRFAPLSEGRVIPANADTTSCNHNHLQCAYHGWEFDATGGCTRVPQDPTKTTLARSVTSYPTRVAGGMVWVWTDPASYDTIGSTIPLPIDPLVEKATANQLNKNAVFMRDLPYGMEILGENLLDLSHLPYAHHSVGQLTRALGAELPTRMMSQQEKYEYAQWERTFNTTRSPVIPRYQAEIINASQHDPILKSMAKSVDPTSKVVVNTSAWQCTISYFDPNHVRYRRTRGPGLAGHVELFFCPLSSGKSRVFLLNVFEATLFPPPPPPKQPFVKALVNSLKPATRKQKRMQQNLQRMFAGANAHLFSHQIFDGDGIFLYLQSIRMKQASLTFRNYSTPSSADILLNTYRRFLDAAATQTRNIAVPDGSKIAAAVVGGAQRQQLKDGTAAAAIVVASDGGTDDLLPRAQLLDRYNTHTKHCKLCLTALQEARAQQARTKLWHTAFTGAAGVSGSSLLAAIVFKVLSKLKVWMGLGNRGMILNENTAMAALDCLPTPLPLSIMIPLGLVAMTGLSCWGSAWATRRIQQFEDRIQQFIFVDYVHAEKN